MREAVSPFCGPSPNNHKDKWIDGECIMKHVFYEEMRQKMGRELCRTSGVSAKAMRKKKIDVVDTAMKLFFDNWTPQLLFKTGVLMDEEVYIKNKRRMYIPCSEKLVQTLWKAKMKVDVSDLTKFPRCFSVAWPKGVVIEGSELPACMVWFGRNKDKFEIAELMQKWIPIPFEYPQGYDMEQYFLSITFLNREGIHIRCSIPEDWIHLCLDSEACLEELYKGWEEIADSLNEEELKQQYVLVRSVVHLMVYATACPDSIVDGWPPGAGAKGVQKKGEPMILMAPKIDKTSGGHHESPEAHWRDWHFRSYPRRRDGAKRDGLVFVRGCMVAGDVDPKTVIQVQDDKYTHSSVGQSGGF